MNKIQTRINSPRIVLARRHKTHKTRNQLQLRILERSRKYKCYYKMGIILLLLRDQIEI